MISQKLVCQLALCLMLVHFGSSVSVNDLPGQIEAILQNPEYKHMTFGISVEQQIEGSNAYTNIYQTNDLAYMVPASNNKIPTIAAAFLRLDPTEQPFETRFGYDPNTGNACVTSRGDPTLNTNDLDDLVNKIQILMNQEGFSSFNVTYDDDWFGSPQFPTAWEWEDITASYASAPNSLMLNQNQIVMTINPATFPGDRVTFNFNNDADNSCVKVANEAYTLPRHSSITDGLQAFYKRGDPRIFLTGQMKVGDSPQVVVLSVPRPAHRFQCVMDYKFKQAGVQVDRKSYVGPCEDDYSLHTSIFADESIYDLMNDTLTNSINLNAEIFLRTLGYQIPSDDDGDAQSNGIIAVKDILTQLGVQSDSFYQNDGSGLSRHNMMSARAMVQIFERMGTVQNAEIFRSFLPVAGVSGTLADRFQGTPAQGRVEAKTGTMSGVSALSGYVDASSSFPQVVFSILINGNSDSASVAESCEDQIVELLATLTP